jgi:hypothetical protein
MRRLTAFSFAFFVCAPACAGDLPTTRGGGEFEPHEGYRCVWDVVLQPSYPSWVLNPDPYNSFIPQYYPVYEWACVPDKPPLRRLSHRRAPPA